jgi:branched-chain amino acid transport system substrate-binding protein
MKIQFSRRAFFASAVGATLAGGFIAGAPHSGLAADDIVIGIPAALSGPVGVADHQDWTNGVTLAIEEINANGGVLGRQLSTKIVDTDILSPEGTVAGIQALTDSGVDAIASAFVLIAQPAMDAAASSGTPYVHGNTASASDELMKADQKKYRNIFQLDVPEVWYGSGYINFLDKLVESGQWEPKNDCVHIVQGQIAYTQNISKATQAKIAKSETWKQGPITDVQFPVQDWAPIIRALHESDCAAAMIDHWVAAELAAFAQQYASDPVEGQLVYLQYGPSQPEFLDLSAGAAEGMIWGTVYGVYADEKGTEFRDKYKEKFPGIMGMVYTGGGYDAVYLLKDAWEKVGNTTDYDAVGDAIRAAEFRGVNGFYKFRPETQSGISYPNMTDDPEAGQAHLIFQVQDDEHRIIAPEPYVEVPFVLAPWMQ